MIYFALIVGIILLHLMLKLNVVVTLITFILAIVMIPVHRKLLQKQKAYEERFLQSSLYLDTILYAFLKEEKIEGAMRDVSRTLPEGRMREEVTQSLELLKMNHDDTTLMEQCLKGIETEFTCKRIHDVHSFMVHVEYYGGEIEKPIKLLLEDKGRWERRIKDTITERKKKMTEIIMSVVMSIIICAVIVHLPILDVDISTNWFLQGFTLLVLILDDWIVIRAQKFLAIDWIALSNQENEEYYVKKMQEYRTYDVKKEKRLSYLLGTGGLILAGYFFFIRYTLQGGIVLLLSVFLFNQHLIGQSLMKKTIIKEIKYAFPNWLLDLVLLLQSENVQVALRKSMAHVPGILQQELKDLLDRLEMEPESSQPYHLFLKDVYLPEVHSAMSALYAISIGNHWRGDRQIGELVDKNLELLVVAERGRLSDGASGMYLLFLAPVLTASFKLLIDMAVLMIHFIQMPTL